MKKDNVLPYILYISRGKIFVFHPNLKSVVELPIPDTIIKDLEIKKMADLENSLTTLVQQNKLAVGPIYIILAPDVVLVKTIPTTTPENLKIQIEEYVKLAPFNHVGFTTVAAGKDTHIIMVNRELFEGFQEILERLGFHVSAVTSALTLGISSAAFTGQIGFDVLKKSQLVFQNSFISDPDKMAQAQNNLSSDPRRNKKLLALLVALGLLILVLGGLVVKMSFFPDKPPVRSQVQSSVQPASTPAATPQTSPVISASPSASLASIKIQVLNASGETGLAQSTKDLLTESGFTLVDTGNSATVSGDRIQIVFSPDLPTSVRETILGALSERFENPATRDGENANDYDAIITLTDTGESGT